ncbi:hypothetical protein E2C01_027503 [Portunus trituberculatus]|uniref:Uncharacterized protein n=1 Tax=Portunus trituberculatus TaxID=210409 RepID=A0A5B7ENW9_PORTR|nr:hypothetical protein [Portunus trituberculatus]
MASVCYSNLNIVLPEKTGIRISSVRQMLNEHKTDSQKFPAAANVILAFTHEAETPADCVRAGGARKRGTDDWEGREWSIMTPGPAVDTFPGADVVNSHVG